MWPTALGTHTVWAPSAALGKGQAGSRDIRRWRLRPTNGFQLGEGKVVALALFSEILGQEWNRDQAQRTPSCHGEGIPISILETQWTTEGGNRGGE